MPNKFCKKNQGIWYLRSNGQDDSQASLGEIVLRILLLHVGGTFGMVASDRGFITEPKQLERRIKKNKLLNSNPNNGENEPFIFKSAEYGGKKKVEYYFKEFETLMDSTEARSGDVAKIVEAIKEYYDEYDGFVIIHGTDTMSYIGSAVAAMINNLGKHVVFTGSMRPMSVKKSDAVGNLKRVFDWLLDNRDLPGVYLLFGKQAMPIENAYKFDAERPNAFRSINYRPSKSREGSQTPEHGARPLPPNDNEEENPQILDGILKVNDVVNGNASGKISDEVDGNVNSKVNGKTSNAVICNCKVSSKAEEKDNEKSEPVKFLKKIEGNIVSVRLTPYTSMLKYALETSRGVVIEGYGDGNIPGYCVEIIKDYPLVPVVIVTQCRMGQMNGHYERGQNLRKCRNIIYGNNMTFEAAVSKLAVFIANVDAEEESEKIVAIRKRFAKLSSAYNYLSSNSQNGSSQGLNESDGNNNLNISI